MGRFRLVDRAPRPKRRNELARYAAPAAFLLAATIAILLIRWALHDDAARTTTAATAGRSVRIVVSKAPTTPRTTRTRTAAAAGTFHTVEIGDTYGALA